MNYTYKAILNGKVYDFPSLAFGFNNALQNVSSINEDEVMIDLDRFKKEAKYQDLKKLAGQCTDSIGMITTETYTKDDEEDFKELNSLGPTIRGFDDRARLFFENGEEEKARKNLIELTELMLDFYSKLLEKDNIKNNNNNKKNGH